MYVCMYVYIRIHKYIKYTNMKVCIYLYTNICLYIHMHMCACVRERAYKLDERKSKKTLEYNKNMMGVRIILRIEP